MVRGDRRNGLRLTRQRHAFHLSYPTIPPAQIFKNNAAQREHVVEYRIAAVFEVLGERDQALHWLRKDIDDRGGLYSWMPWLNHDPAWKSMREDRRFKAIQQRAGW